MRRRAIEISNFFKPTRAHVSLPPRNNGVILIPPKEYNSAEPIDEIGENSIAPALGSAPYSDVTVFAIKDRSPARPRTVLRRTRPSAREFESEHRTAHPILGGYFASITLENCPRDG